MNWEPFLLGLSTGGVCLTHCLPSTIPYFLSSSIKLGQNSLKALLFILGRLVGYLLFGAVLGALGYFSIAQMDETDIRVFTITANIVLGVFLLIFGIGFQFPRLKLCTLLKQPSGLLAGSFFLGLMTGISFCPPFISAGIKAFQTASIGEGIFYFLCFFLGTSLYLLPLLFIPVLKRYEGALNKIAQMALIITGLYFLFIKGVFVL